MHKTLSISIMILMVLVGCTREPTPAPVIRLSRASACKGHEPGNPLLKLGKQECLHFQWIEGDTLALTHLNTDFNCCPEGFTVDASISGDTLIISENEKSSLCDCICLYDLEYKITGIGHDIWWVRIGRPGAGKANADLTCRIDLKALTSGDYCEDRSGYPWGN